MDSDADQRFRRLASAIAHDALLPDEGGRPLELDVRDRTFTYQGRDGSGRLVTLKVAVLEPALKVREGIGELASGAWGEQLSDEEGWFRFALSSWQEGLATAEDTGSEWRTFDAGRGVVPLPPWEAHDYSPPLRRPSPRPRRRLVAYAPLSGAGYAPTESEDTPNDDAGEDGARPEAP
ncbi:hypothetical protein [Pseudokineococcus sp. 1T1Z-3]|uniref:hypothetical protein n=1 Tax=Pseudokineococcus sp. 1T1Z-3 TaxID=3132745 RepID=UPI0030999DC4